MYETYIPNRKFKSTRISVFRDATKIKQKINRIKDAILHNNNNAASYQRIG